MTKFENLIDGVLAAIILVVAISVAANVWEPGVISLNLISTAIEFLVYVFVGALIGTVIYKLADEFG